VVFVPPVDGGLNGHREKVVVCVADVVALVMSEERQEHALESLL